MEKIEKKVGYVYVITNLLDTNDKYIGSTTRSLQRRFKEHLLHGFNENSPKYNRKLYVKIREFGKEFFEISLLENVLYDNKLELHKREQYFIDTLKSNLNTNNAFIEDKDNYNHNYYQTNKDRLTIIKKDYSIEHKDKIAVYQKKWRENNKEILTEKKHQYYVDNKEEYVDKGKQYREKNKEILIEKHQEYYKTHKEQIAETGKKYRDDNKEHITESKKLYAIKNKEAIQAKNGAKCICTDCKKEYTQQHKARHEKTKYHIKSLIVI